MNWRDRLSEPPAAGDRPTLEAVLDQEPDARPVVGYPDYLIHSDGRLWSTVTNRFLKGSQNRDGYRTFSVRNRSCYAHTLVLEAFVGPRPPGHVARHLNDMPDDNRLANLSWGTRQENAEDYVRNGGRYGAIGENQSRAKLTEAEVLEIRDLRKHGWRYTELGRTYGVAESTIKSIIKRRNWRHI